MTILEKNHDYLHVIATVCGYLNETNSSAEKTRRLMSLGNTHEALGLGADAPDIFHRALRMTYSPYVKYGVTSENIRKFMGQQPEISFEEDEDMFMLLDDLSNNPSSGHATIKRIVHFLNSLGNDVYVETFLNIIDKNLKIRMDSKSINKACPELIPEFEVSLCKVYDEYRSKVKFEKDVWYASRKLDGCVSGDTLITMENGERIPIKEIVESKIEGKVQTYNPETGKIEFNKILNHMKNMDDINESKYQWYEIELDDGRKIRLTGNHKVFIPELGCYRRVDELTGDESFLVD